MEIPTGRALARGQLRGALGSRACAVISSWSCMRMAIGYTDGRGVLAGGWPMCEEETRKGRVAGRIKDTVGITTSRPTEG